MTTKEYLSQAYRIDQRIDSKLEQVLSLRALLGKATATLTETPRSATLDPRSMEDVVAKMVDLETEINEDIDTLVDLKQEITRVIKGVENPEHQTLLELRYLCFRRWEDIAVELGYTSRHMFRIHDLAVTSVRLPPDSG